MESFARTLIIGNSGSDKGWLANAPSERLTCSAIDLDDLHWEPGGYSVLRAKQQAARDVTIAAEADAWVIEGVYGWLADLAVPRATTLVWLDLPVEDCLTNLNHRGLRGGGDTQAFLELLDWARAYRERDGLSSWVGHKKIYESFSGLKVRLTSRPDMDALVGAA